MMARIAALAVCLFAAANAYAANEPPVGSNCSLPAPPKAAGESIGHDITLRVFPRARDIGKDYVGCQTMWMPGGKDWRVVTVVAIDHGDPIRLWHKDAPNDPSLSCRYKDGKLILGAPKDCAEPQFLIIKSVAPGCVDKIKAATASGGPGVPNPKGCEWE